MRIAYLTDSHLGASAEGFHAQTYWTDGVAELMQRLRRWVDAEQIDLVIHGGDLVEAPHEPQLKQAVEQIAALGKPVLMCLGNHDLCNDGAMDRWREEVARHEQVTLADAHLSFDDCDLYALNNHWLANGDPELYWDPTPPYRHVPAWGPGQLDWLDGQLSRDGDRPAIVIVHTQIDAIHEHMPELDDYIPEDYSAGLNEVLDRHPHCRLLMCGHCHLTRAIGHGSRIHLTTGALSETPFHVRLIEVGQESVAVSTHTLGDAPPNIALDTERMWVLGEEHDRQFVMPLCKGV